MQTEVPVLPVVCSDGHNKRSTRNSDRNEKSSIVEIKNHNTCKISTSLVSNRKQLHPLVGGPYRNSMRLYALSEPIRSTNKTTVGQRVMSAKMLRVKQLQNQLTDAHYHLNELANENRLLKALQKRQDSALRRYEGTNAELPRIINSHHEELKVLQMKHKKLKIQHKHTCDLLKERENEIHSLQSQNKHLVQLSKDRNLEERDKLQMRVSDLNFRIQQQQETIQTLNRKLALESKSLKHQLNAEVAKHKETQKHLYETLEKLKNLEDLLDNREKRLYYSGRLPVCNKGKTVGTQSLMNLGQNGVPPNPLKSGSKSRGSQNDPENGSLPKITRTESSDERTIQNLKVDRNEESPVTETMSSLQQVRKFRLKKSYSRNGSAGLLTNAMDKSEEDETARNETNSIAKYSNIEKLRAKRETIDADDEDDEEIKKFVQNFEITNGQGAYKLPEQLMREFGYSSSDSESETDTREKETLESRSLASKSRDLHTRLIREQTTIVNSFSVKTGKSKISASTSGSESESENHVKTVSTGMDDYCIALRGRPRNGENNDGGLSVEDFLKLDINATNSDLETERVGKTNAGKLEKSSDAASDGSLAEGYKDSRQSLASVTKTWTELRAKIKRDREISENQLRELERKSSEDEFLLEKKLGNTEAGEYLSKDRGSSIAGKTSENFEKSYDDTSVGSSRAQRRVNNRGKVPVENSPEIPHAQQNGAVEDSRTSENVSTNKNEISEGDRASSLGKELETITRNFEDSTITRDASRELSEKITENGTLNDKVVDESTDAKLVNFNKQKLLAAMKAIDDNENIDFLTSQKHRGPNTSARAQSTITENLYRGLPTHARKKDDILKEIFGDGKVENKLRAGCSKLH